MSDESNTLKAQTEAKIAAGRKGNPAFMKGVDESIAQAKSFQEGANALALEQIAPSFELPNQHGQSVQLTELLAKGPVVVTFYRGSWCPYCNLQLKALQARLPEIHALGAQLVAISPQVPDLESLNNGNGSILPIPATFVLNSEGKVTWRYVDVDYRTRSEPEDIINALKALS